MVAARSKWKEKLDDGLESILNSHLKPFADYPRVFATIAGGALALYSGAVESHSGVFQYVNKAFSPDSVMVNPNYWGVHALLGSIAGFYVGHALGRPLAKYLHRRGCYSIFKLPQVLWIDRRMKKIDQFIEYISKEYGGSKNNPENVIAELEETKISWLKARTELCRDARFAKIKKERGLILGELLGTGATAVIYTAHSLSCPEQKLVVKIVTDEPLMKTPNTKRLSSIPLRERLKGDASIEQRIKGLGGFLSQMSGYDGVDEEGGYTWRAYQYAGPTLREYFGKLSPEEKERFIVKYMGSLILTIKSLHEQNLVHRDIKLDNLYVDEEIDGGALVGDIDTIGDVSLLLSRREGTDTVLETIGSPAYMSPEAVADYQRWIHGAPHKPTVDWKKNDVFEIGVVLYNLLFGNYPNNRHNWSERRYALNRLSSTTEEYTKQLSETLDSLSGHRFYNILAGCLNPYQDKRWDIHYLHSAFICQSSNQALLNEYVVLRKIIKNLTREDIKGQSPQQLDLFL